MKRLVTIGAVITAFAIAPALASAGTTTQAKPRTTAQVISTQVTSVQRAQAAISLQTHRVQIAQAQRWATLRALVR